MSTPDPLHMATIVTEIFTRIYLITELDNIVVELKYRSRQHGNGPASDAFGSAAGLVADRAAMHREYIRKVTTT